MHTLWEQLRTPSPQHVFFTSTSLKKKERRKKTTTTGLVLMSSHFCHFSVEHKEKLLQPKLWANQHKVIYSAYSFLTRSTSSSQHGLLLITPAAQDIVVWSFLSVTLCSSYLPFFTVLLTYVCVAQATGQWIMRTKLKHIASLSVLVSGWWL